MKKYVLLAYVIFNSALIYSQNGESNLFESNINKFDSLSKQCFEVLMVWKNYSEIEKDTLKIFYKVNEKDSFVRERTIYFGNGFCKTKERNINKNQLKCFNQLLNQQDLSISNLNNNISNLPVLELKYKSLNSKLTLTANPYMRNKMFSKELIKILKTYGREFCPNE